MRNLKVRGYGVGVTLESGGSEYVIIPAAKPEYVPTEQLF